MPTLTIESAVYPFEGLLPELESPPIAARRALDHAGFRLSVEGWRSLSPEERQRITIAGVPDRVDAELVGGLIRRATPPAARISAASDPDPVSPPDALVKALEPHRAIDARRWSRFRAVDRYALAHTYRRAVARSAFSILGEALDAVVAINATQAVSETPQPPRTASTPPPPPGGAANPYQPAGYYSSFVTPPHPRDALRVAGDSLAPGPVADSPRPPPLSAQSPLPPHKTPTQPRTAALTDAAHDAPPSSSRPTFTGESPRPAAYDAGGVSRSAGAGRGFATFPPPPGAISNHLNQAGEMHMVDVARKPKTERQAIARGTVQMRPDTLARLVHRETPKGEVLAAARLAGIMAAKRTHEIIPLCHMVALTHLEVVLEVDPYVHAGAAAVHVTAVADAYDRTGCEMEAMVAVSAACLTLYDMLKGIDRDMVIADVKLMEKSGGRSGHYLRAEIKP